MNNGFKLICSCLAVAATATPVAAQEAGEVNIGVSFARTKLVDKGDVFTDGVQDPEAAYETREAYHSEVKVEYFPVDSVALVGSASTPLTTNNIPAGSLAGLPNLGDDEFVMLTAGAAFYPLKGAVRPYIGGGIAFQITTQERDGLAVGLNIPNAHGPYVNAGLKVAVNNGLDVFVDARKAWYSTAATGLLPLDESFTTFAEVYADAVLDPLTLQLGLGTRFGHSNDAALQPEPREAGDVVVKAGLTNLRLRDEIDLAVAGVAQEGAGDSTFEHQIPSVQLAYFLTDALAINATLGVPPKISVYGAGAIGPLPRLGKVRYGPTLLSLQYHLPTTGRIRPYVGAGVSYMIVFDTDDGAFENLELSNDIGPAFEAGVEFAVGPKTGLFLDVKKAFLRPTATGTFQGLQVVGDTKLDPWAFTAGLSFTL